MGAVDFSEWAAPALSLTFGGRTYEVQPPSVEGAKQLLAAAVRGEVNLGMVKDADGKRITEVPAEVQAVLDTIGPDEHPALGEAYARLVADGVPQQTIDRMAYYATFYWARGKEYADSLALILFAPRDVDAEEPAGEPAPKD